MGKIQPLITTNGYGKLNDFMRLRKEQKEKSDVKFTLPPKTVYYSTDSFIPLNFNNSANIVKSMDFSKKTSNIEKTNQVEFPSAKPINLGDYSGESIELKDFGGLMISPFVVPPSAASKPGQKSNPLEEREEMLSKKLTVEQQREIHGICYAISTFKQVTDGEISIQSQSATETQEAMKLLLEKMGVDLKKPFAINGEEFFVRSDNGKIDYLNMKKYVKREDGKIEIQAVSKYTIKDNKVVEL